MASAAVLDRTQSGVSPLPYNWGSMEAAFWSKIDRSGECWLWTGSVNGEGFPTAWVPAATKEPGQRRGGKVVALHRHLFELSNGPIPPKEHLRRTCDGPRRCVRPDHYVSGRATSTKTNAFLARATCPQGHPLDGLRQKGERGRYCRTCDRARNMARRQAKAVRGEAADRWPTASAVSAARVRARRWNSPGRGLTPAEWRAILADYGYRCAYCLTDGPMTLEHVVPLARGGAHDPDNIVPACLPCNKSKHRHSVIRFYLNRRNDQLRSA